MKIDRLILGDYQTNCYVLRSNDEAKDCLIIDTGLDAAPLVRLLQGHKLNPVAVVFTHGHADHITGLAPLRLKFPSIKVCIHKLDADCLSNPAKNLSALAGVNFASEAAEVLLEQGDSLEYSRLKLQVLHTPGHTPGGICLYSHTDAIAFTGDTLFAGSVGRCDFPNGNLEQLLKSIREKLLTLPEETILYPGHGPSTTIAQEKAVNPYLLS